MELGYIYKKEMQKNKYSESIGGIHKCWKSITRRISIWEKKDYQARMMKGEKPTLEVLDDILPARGSCSEVSLGLVQIPMEQIVGTKNRIQKQCLCREFYAHSA